MCFANHCDFFDGDQIIHGKQQQKIEELNNERSVGDQVFCACVRACVCVCVCVFVCGLDKSFDCSYPSYNTNTSSPQR